jgi:hypothetical protein
VGSAGGGGCLPEVVAAGLRITQRFAAICRGSMRNCAGFLGSKPTHNPYLKALRRSIASLAPAASLSDHVTLSVSLCRL